MTSQVVVTRLKCEEMTIVDVLIVICCFKTICIPCFTRGQVELVYLQDQSSELQTTETRSSEFSESYYILRKLPFAYTPRCQRM